MFFTSTPVIAFAETNTNGKNSDAGKEVAGDTVSHYTYDKSGNRYAEYITDTSGMDSVPTLSLYDADGNSFAQISQPAVSRGTYIIGEDSVATYSAYDASGNLVRESSGTGIVTTYDYDDEKRLVACNIDDTGDADDISVGYVSTAAAGQIMTITDANGNRKTESQNWNGLVTKTSDIWHKLKDAIRKWL